MLYKPQSSNIKFIKSTVAVATLMIISVGLASCRNRQNSFNRPTQTQTPQNNNPTILPNTNRDSDSNSRDNDNNNDTRRDSNDRRRDFNDRNTNTRDDNNRQRNDRNTRGTNHNRSHPCNF
ncbi:MAG: hypothetical protein AAF378_13100 [Cyanobacteria bacterium P01_A01_bin.84]